MVKCYESIVESFRKEYYVKEENMHKGYINSHQKIIMVTGLVVLMTGVIGS